MKSEDFSDIEKLLAFRKWRWNEMPADFRRQEGYQQQLRKDLEMIRKGKKVKSDTPPSIPCLLCRSESFYRMPHGLICANCHPPVGEKSVDWIKIN